MQVLIADRALLNGYTIGLAAGLNGNGVETWIGGPAAWEDMSVVSLYPRAGTVGQRLRKTCDAVAGSARCNKLLAKRPHLLHLQWPSALDAAYALAARRVHRIPIAYTVHNFGRSDSPRYEAMQRRFIALADLVLTHGPWMRQEIVAAFPRAADKTHVVEHGNYEHVISRFPRTQARLRLGLPVDEPLFAFVGQLRPRKGVDLLLAAFHEYRCAGGSGHLLVAGTATVPGYEQRLRQMAEPDDAAIHWCLSDGPVAQATLDLAISAATEVVLPFHLASQSGSLIMAMTHGRCVVSTAGGEVSRTLRGRGVVIERGDRDALVEALALGESNPSHCDKLGARARQHALTELAWPRIAARTAGLYCDVRSSA